MRDMLRTEKFFYACIIAREKNYDQANVTFSVGLCSDD